MSVSVRVAPDRPDLQFSSLGRGFRLRLAADARYHGRHWSVTRRSTAMTRSIGLPIGPSPRLPRGTLSACHRARIGWPSACSRIREEDLSPSHLTPHSLPARGRHVDPKLAERYHGTLAWLPWWRSEPLRRLCIVRPLAGVCESSSTH